MGDTSLNGNRKIPRIGGQSQGCACSISKPDFQIPHRDLSRLGGTESPRCFDFSNGVADLFFGGGKRLSSLRTASRRCCCAHPWPRPPGDGNHFPCFLTVSLSPMSPNGTWGSGRFGMDPSGAGSATTRFPFKKYNLYPIEPRFSDSLP
jgi:hypothetical protein